MSGKLISFGDLLPDLNAAHLSYGLSRKILSLCNESKDFEVIELRRLVKDDKTWDIIVADCINDQVPSRNAVGIKVRELLALAFTEGNLPDVRALRKDFPRTVPHLNHVLVGEPTSLCLYDESWKTLERTWTPQRHLRRILWWLTETSKEKLHKYDQPIEPLYFDSPFQIVLPLDFEQKMQDPSLVLIPVPIPLTEQPEPSFKIIRAQFKKKTLFEPKKPASKIPSLVPIANPLGGEYILKDGVHSPVTKPEMPKIMHYHLLPLKISPVVHGVIEQYPNTLGKLYDQLEHRGESVFDELNKAIKEKAQNGLSLADLDRCLLILWVPMKLSKESESKLTTYAFDVNTNLATLGEKTGALVKGQDGKVYPDYLLGEVGEGQPQKWRELEIFPIAVIKEVDKDFARIASGIDVETADFKGVLGGVGALGSALAELWAKEHWGEWLLIDPDFIRPHNIIRHIAKDLYIGSYKVNAVKDWIELNYANGYYNVSAIPKNIQDIETEKDKGIFETMDLFVDATTTIEVPRDLSQRERFPRSVSIFLTPSGQGSVLLMESKDRSLKLDALEAQYYRAIINSDWGAGHLMTDKDNLRIGPACRDVSAVMSYETIQFHAALLSKQIRLMRDRPEPHIRVWSADYRSGALSAYEVHAYPYEYYHRGDWEVILDSGIRDTLVSFRKSRLPNETGGVIIGYIDQKLHHIYVVDVLQAPPDSEEDRAGFTRGMKGLNGVLEEVARRTRNIVGYLGEWHSHPAFTSAYPSKVDQELIKQLSKMLDLDGLPALMVIVGSAGDISVSVKEDKSNEVKR